MSILIPYDFGIFAIDAHYQRPRLAAIHVILEKGRVAFFDTGTTHSMPRVFSGLKELGLGAEAVDFVIPSHVHLDHAGGAGAMMAAFPNARLVVHPRGARHLATPDKLWAGTVAVYGEVQAAALYGTIVPVDPARIIAASDGGSVSLAGRELRLFDTPGHARHHLCLQDSRSGHLFVGDMFGLSYRELDVGARMAIFPTTTPVQFEPDAMQASIRRLLALTPGAMYLTHFGRVTDIQRLGDDLLRLVAAHVALAERHADAGNERHARMVGELRDLLLAEQSRQRWPLAIPALLDLMAADIELNAQGLGSWLDARARQPVA